MKTIVTHLSVDLDSITSCWLIKRFLPGWSKAIVKFVPAGSTLNSQPPDEKKEVIHVDTGLGRFDHHQTRDYTCATKLMYEFLVEKHYLDHKLIAPLDRVTCHVNDIDHFAEVNFHDPTADCYDFSLHQLIEGLRATLRTDQKIIEVSFQLLDSVLHIFRKKIKAESDLLRGFTFRSKWGKAIAFETINEDSIRLALKSGYSLALRKDPEKKSVRIKTLPDKRIDLTPIYEKIKKIDKRGSWFLHISKNMLLNGSSTNPNFIPTGLSLKKLIEIISQI